MFLGRLRYRRRLCTGKPQEQDHRYHRRHCGLLVNFMDIVVHDQVLGGFMELIIWLEYLYLWRLQREHGIPKQEDLVEEDELPEATYPVE